MRAHAGMPLAIEPLHPMYAADRACVNTLEQALDICDALDPGAIAASSAWRSTSITSGGIPSSTRRSRAPARERLLAYHVCDWLVPTRDLLLDRGMMGDGVIELPRIRGWVEAAGYPGLIEVEIFSERLVGAADRRGARHLRRALSHRRLTTRRPERSEA